MALRVFLGDVPVGRIEREGADFEFRFDASYCARGSRPVLGLAFEERPPASYDDEPLTGGGKVPKFFRNYLPEGVLLTLAKGAVETFVDPDYHLLAHLGEDLPGNVRIVADELLPDASLAHATAPVDPMRDLRFSLAGVQLKLSVLRAVERVTIPVRGAGGRWIAKFPTGQFSGICENEHAMLRWARLSGITVPDHELVPIERFDGTLPEGFAPGPGPALLVRRYDREGDKRVHQEDFAQVLGLAPDEKYGLSDNVLDETLHLMTVANIVRRRCGRDDFDEFLRRVVFTVLSGNGDMHFKNWSLYYPDPQRPRLAPAYDLVCTVQYVRAHPLAVGLCDPYDRALGDVVLARFERVAAATGDDPARVRALVSDFVRACMAAWRALRDEVPAPTRAAVEDLHKRLALLRECAG